MELPDAITGGLPAPRDDEPATLRQDLVDELNDHLQTSLQRELRSVPDRKQAWQNVLARFGDPRKVLRQLWCQAMKEQIMSQRFMLVLSSVMTLACVAALGLVWLLVQQSRDAQAALLDKISASSLQAKASNLPAAEWGVVKVKLTLDDEKKSPAGGFLVTLNGRLFKEAEGASVDVVSDSNGIADFGSVRIGWHGVVIVSPAQERYRESLFTRPGQETTLSVLCPVPPPEAEVTFDLSLPEDLREQTLWTACSLVAQPRMVGGKKWSPIPYSIIFDAQGRIVYCGHPLENDWEWRWDESMTTEPSQRTNTAHLPALEYTIETLAISKPFSDSKAQLKREAIKSVLGTIENGDFGRVQPVPGRSTHVAIHLPEKLLEDVRKKLAEPAEPTDSSDAAATEDAGKSERVE